MATVEEHTALDAEVAVRVFGWTYDGGGGGTRPDGLWDLIPWYTLSADADYTVLHHVRETWDHAARFRFGRALVSLWQDRADMGGAPAMRYRAGDYSRAALVALNEGEG